MSDAICSIVNGETVDLLRECAMLCGQGREATPRSLGLDGQSLNLVVSSPDGEQLSVDAYFQPDSVIAYNNDNGHLVAKLQLGRAEVPVVFDTRHEGLISFSVFPTHLNWLVQRAGAYSAA